MISNCNYLLVLFFLLTFDSHILLVITAIDFAFSHEIRYPHYSGYIIFCSVSFWLQVSLHGDYEVLWLLQTYVSNSCDSLTQLATESVSDAVCLMIIAGLTAF